MENFKEIEVFGYDYKRMISYLETLEQEYLDNLHSCTAAKGYCEFLWYDINEKHIPDNEGIDIPDGDWWSNSSKFISEWPMHESCKAFENFDIMLEQLKGQSLINAIEYWCIANRIYINIEDDATYKAIDKKTDELLKILKL